MDSKKQIQIYNNLKERAIKLDHFFGRKLITVSYANFRIYEKYFVSSFNLFNTKENFRTVLGLKHIHAIKDGDLVEIHYDYGNTKKHIAFILIHFFVDVIPYFVWFFIKWKKPYGISEK